MQLYRALREKCHGKKIILENYNVLPQEEETMFKSYRRVCRLTRCPWVAHNFQYESRTYSFQRGYRFAFVVLNVELVKEFVYNIIK